MKIALLIIWVIIGLINLIALENIPKLSYGSMWLVLMIALIRDLGER